MTSRSQLQASYCCANGSHTIYINKLSLHDTVPTTACPNTVLFTVSDYDTSKSSLTFTTMKQSPDNPEPLANST